MTNTFQLKLFNTFQLKF